MFLKKFILQRCLQNNRDNVEQAATENEGHRKARCCLFLSQSTFFCSCLPTVHTATATDGSRGKRVLPPLSELLINSILAIMVRQTEENLMSSETVLTFDYPTGEVLYKWLRRRPATCEGSK